MKTRFAPTPSGFLHRGNALNFILIWKKAREVGGSIFLRIDDHDYPRVRKEYIDNIFKTIDWLGIDFDEGPNGTEDFLKNFSQKNKFQYYESELKKINPTFSCLCSRSDLAPFNGVYPGRCVHKKLFFNPGETCLRWGHVDKKSLNKLMHYPILWRKDNIPSYQLVSTIEDRDQRITDIIRGEDLVDSSEFQKYLAKQLNWSFPENISHHSLLKFEGEKISKSNLAPTLFDEFSSSKDFYESIISEYLGFKVSKSSDIIPLGR